LAQDFLARSLSQLDLDDLTFDWFGGLRERIAARGVVMSVYVLATVLRTPAFLCELTEPDPSGPRARVYGSACHPRAETALAKAVLEAVQSRLTYISGARDDFLAVGRQDLPAFGFAAPMPPGVAGIGWADAAGSGAAMIEAKPLALARALAERGYPQTAVVDLSPPSREAFVFKAVCPGLGAFERMRRAPVQLN
jgi:ribosomal protein S12 methylthiotransferase accessory factor